ncbi:hypothetical protein ACFOUP_12520 [Belliella kenyensis]|uniref:DUF4402 domain-containing protein n=1 Tax=Belliella kenyensis TaxID=1472724 RepID=A0ABV8ELK1_9BACT|nr:hypothetical protein [Belliella kenyensis]MCH7400797.1 hypothetical protein [Belliella kenyensis]MDN3601915.1 hypothetical protein [Belliella kenyensis]
MKKPTLLLFAIMLCYGLAAQAQTVKGGITIGKTSELKIETKSDNIIDLFVEFRKDKYPILFSFQGDNIKSKNDREIIFFDFITEVYFNGKLIGKASRNPMPYIPGDMIIGTEGFDFISLLSFNELTKALIKDAPGKLPKGSYQVKLIAKPLDYKGQIKPGIFSFNVQ